MAWECSRRFVWIRRPDGRAALERRGEEGGTYSINLATKVEVGARVRTDGDTTVVVRTPSPYTCTLDMTDTHEVSGLGGGMAGGGPPAASSANGIPQSQRTIAGPARDGFTPHACHHLTGQGARRKGQERALCGLFPASRMLFSVGLVRSLAGVRHPTAARGEAGTSRYTVPHTPRFPYCRSELGI